MWLILFALSIGVVLGAALMLMAGRALGMALGADEAGQTRDGSGQERK